MMRFLLLAVVASVSCSSTALAELVDGRLSAFGRTIDLDAWLALAPAESFFIDQPAQRIYLAASAGEAKQVAQLPLLTQSGARPADIAMAMIVSNVDVSKRNFWGAGYSKLLD